MGRGGTLGVGNDGRRTAPRGSASAFKFSTGRVTLGVPRPSRQAWTDRPRRSSYRTATACGVRRGRGSRGVARRRCRRRRRRRGRSPPGGAHRERLREGARLTRPPHRPRRGRRANAVGGRQRDRQPGGPTDPSAAADANTLAPAPLTAAARLHHDPDNRRPPRGAVAAVVPDGHAGTAGRARPQGGAGGSGGRRRWPRCAAAPPLQPNAFGHWRGGREATRGSRERGGEGERQQRRGYDRAIAGPWDRQGGRCRSRNLGARGGRVEVVKKRLEDVVGG